MQTNVLTESVEEILERVRKEHPELSPSQQMIIAKQLVMIHDTIESGPESMERMHTPQLPKLRDDVLPHHRDQKD